MPDVTTSQSGRDESPLWWRHGGHDDGPVLVLIHGLGATADVFGGFIDKAQPDWPGSVLAPDLRGHGRSRWAARYSFGQHAADVAALLPAGRDVYVLGHSMGGVVGLALAGGLFGVDVRGVVGLGIKVTWSDDDLARAAHLAHREPAVFDSKDEAAARFLKVSGLAGLCGRDDPIADAGLRRAEHGWTLAMDPKTFGVGAPDMPGLLREAQCPVLLACGVGDPMVSVTELDALRPGSIELAGLGHNAHVEDPAVVLGLVTALLPAAP
ncbi:MAG: alpha/beta fold hydrolase [Jiangellaceae bacterium]